nr:restriction endonuclease subunit S [Pseudoalteromonas sp. WY3]
MEWSIVKLGDITEVITKGTTPTSVGFKFIPEGVNFVKVESITSDGRFLPHKFAAISEECNESLKRSQLKEGDVLFSIAGALGRTALVTPDILPANTNQALAIIRLKAGLVIDKHFLLLALTTRVTLDQVEKSKGGVAQQNLSLGQLKGFEIPLPPIPEQKRIVAILDQAFADIEQARAKTEQNLKNARELFESYLQQVFSQRGEGWVESELFEHVKFIDYRGKTPKKTEQGLRLITAKNVRMGYLKVEPQEFVAPESYEGWMTRGIPQKGDVLFTTEAPLANVAQLDTDEKTVFAQRIITMQPDQNILNSTFLKYMLMSQPIQQLIHDKGTGATCTGIKASLLKKIPITYPSDMNEQVEYVDVLDSLTDKVKLLESIYIQKLSALDNLKKSILQKAFSGELTKTLEVDTNKGAVA